MGNFGQDPNEAGMIEYWHVQPGQDFKLGQTLYTMNVPPDKASVDVQAPSDGRLGAHLVPTGGTARMGDVIGTYHPSSNLPSQANDGYFHYGESEYAPAHDSNAY